MGKALTPQLDSIAETEGKFEILGGLFRSTRDAGDSNSHTDEDVQDILTNLPSFEGELNPLGY